MFSSFSTVASGIHKKTSVLNVTDNSGTYTTPTYTGTITPYASTITDSSGVTYSNVYYLKSSGTLTMNGSGNKTVYFYIVGGGGNGCACNSSSPNSGAGGGGGGGIIMANYAITTSRAFTISVGLGGQPWGGSFNTRTYGADGSASTVTIGTTTYTANGGRGAGSSSDPGQQNTGGASGGGLNTLGKGSSGSGKQTSPLWGGSGQLFYDGKFYGGGGGAGASSIPCNNTYVTTPTYSWQGTTYNTTTQNANGTTGNGGLGGGSSGGRDGDNTAQSAIANTGGGAGGERNYRSYTEPQGANGGSGIVIVYW
jgi:hypothetical protein